MIGWGNIFGAGVGASLILNSANNKRASKYIASQERESARIQFEINKKEIERAYETNLQGMLKGFATQRLGLFDEAEKASSNLNIQLGERKNIDKENDSFKDDSKKMLESEVQENILAMMEQQNFSLRELINESTMQMYQTGMSLNSTISGINKNKIRADQQANSMLMSGIEKAGDELFQLYERVAPWTGETEEASDKTKVSNFGMPRAGINPLIGK